MTNGAGHEVSIGVTLFFAALLVSMILCLALEEKLHAEKSVIVGANVTAMIIVGSLTGVSLSRLGISDRLLGFLLIEGFLTNVGGLLTLISSVPNIIVGNAAGISFATFFVKAAPYVVVTTAVTIGMGAKFFGIHRLAGLVPFTPSCAR